MKKITNQFNGSHADRINNGGGRFRRIALFPLMLFMLLLVPTSMVAQTDYDNTVTFTALEDNFTLKPSTVYAVFNETDGTLTFRYDTNKPEGAYDLNEDVNEPAWNEQSANINKVVFDASFAKAKPTSCYKWFDDCTNLTQIEGIENLNTVDVSDMTYMFAGCSGLTSLNLSKFNTQNVTDMCYMFYGCSGLTSLDLSKFDTQNVTDMSVMFNGCFGLTSLDLSNFNTQNVKDMTHMFYACSGLTSLDLSKFNTQNVTDMSGMFFGCSGLTTIYVSDKFVTAKVDDGADMFFGCTSLKGATVYDDSKVDQAYANCDTGYFTPGCAYAEFDEGTGTLTFKCGLSKPAGAYDLNEGDNAPEWIKKNWSTNDHIKNVVFDASFANARPTSCKLWFYNCNNLTEIEGIANLNTEEVTGMDGMFHSCSKLTSLDLSNFNTQKVTNMGGMFYGCSKLTSLDISKFDTQNVTNMEAMFLGCSKLTSLDVSKFNTQNVTDMSNMFSGCSGLTSLDISKFDTQKVTGMVCMFSGCSKLTLLNLSKFDTQNVTDMTGMFDGCSGITSLDLSKFDTQKVTNMRYMFNGCSALTTIYVSDKFVTTKVSDGTDMFYGCTSLKGAIKYEDSSYGYPEYGYPGYGEGKTDHTYANYKTGYFTKLVGKNGNDKIGAVGEVLTAESLALADDKDFEAYEPFTAKTATYTRTLKEGTSWATLCLPFEVSLADQNFRAFELLSADETTNTVELKEIETSIAAGTPVIIKMKEGQTALNFSVANKEIANNVKTAATVDGSYQLQGLYTKKVFDKDADNNCYIVKGDKLMNPAKLLENTSTTQVGSKPFRAYMVDNTSSSAGAKMFSIAIGDNTTAIDSLNTIADDKAVYYDLQGNRLNAPQKGINIVKRGSKTMKVIIK